MRNGTNGGLTPNVAAGRSDVSTFFRRQEGEKRERESAKRRDAGHNERNNATRFQRFVVFVKIVAHIKLFHRVQIMIRVKEGHIVDQIVVDVVNALIDRVVEEIKRVVAIVDRGRVSAHRFAVAARVFDAFVKNAERIDGEDVAAEEKGADDRKNGGDGEESPTLVRGRGGRRGGRRNVDGGFDGRRLGGGRDDFVGRRSGGRVVVPNRKAFYFKHRRNAERLAALAGERLAGLRRFDRG